MTKGEFDNRVKFNGGYDRIIDDWKVIDIHIIPATIEEYHEFDFYCNKNDVVILLRIRNREKERYEIIKNNTIDYWIAELSADIIDNDLILKVLNKFQTIKNGTS